LGYLFLYGATQNLWITPLAKLSAHIVALIGGRDRFKVVVLATLFGMSISVTTVKDIGHKIRFC
jgi:hypothetical protein